MVAAPWFHNNHVQASTFADPHQPQLDAVGDSTHANPCAASGRLDLCNERSYSMILFISLRTDATRTYAI